MNIPSYYTLQQCDQVKVENTTMPYMKSFYSCLNRMIGEGYSDTFEEVSDLSFKSKKTGNLYRKSDIRVVNFFSFEGNANSKDNVIMYILETVDGVKGTLVTSLKSLLLHDTRKENLYE